jgi:hypothetical protein
MVDTPQAHGRLDAPRPPDGPERAEPPARDAVTWMTTNGPVLSFALVRDAAAERPSGPAERV